MPLQRLAQCQAMRAPVGGADGIARVRQRGEQCKGAGEKPSQPDALPLAASAHQVHPVVPVTTADQRQAVFTRQADATVDAARTVLEQRCADLSHHGLEEQVVVPGSERRPVEKGDALVKHPGVIRSHHIGRRGERQPDAIVRNPRAHALP
ncbi:hypothetical protein D3C86_1307860 [compost metagenome]